MTISSVMSSWMRLMSHPAAVFGGLAAGVAVGLASAPVAAALAPVGQLYVSLLTMLVLPFMVSAIIVSLARLWNRSAAGAEIGRLATAMVIFMAVAALVGIGTGLAMAPGKVDGGPQAALGRIVSNSTGAFAGTVRVDLSARPRRPDEIKEVSEAIAHVFPNNIFNALSLGNSLQVVIFSLLFGLALGATPHGGANALIDALEMAFRGCQTMMRGVNALLPIAMCAMVAPLVGHFAGGAGGGSLQAMMMFVVAQIVGTAVLFGLAAVTIGWRTGIGTVAGIVALREPITMAFGTRNSIACIPSVIDKMSAQLGLIRDDLELVVPLGIALCRFGPVTYYAIATLFIAQIYAIHLTLAQLAIVMMASMMAGLASSGSSGIITIAMVGLVCGPLGLPIGAAMVLFIAVEPIIAGFRVLAIVHGTCALAALTCQRERVEGAAGQVIAP